MVRFSHLRLPNGRYAILYRFDKRGEGLPLHQHGDDTAHAIVCTRGSIRITVPEPNRTEGLNPGYTPLPILRIYELTAGKRHDGETHGPHEIVALVDGASVLNEFVNDPPASYAALPPEALEGSADLTPLIYPLGAS